MADAVTSQTIIDGERNAVLLFTNLSDGTGESGVLKVDVSALNPNQYGQPCASVTIKAVRYDIFGMSVSIIWDATTDVTALILAGYGKQDFTKAGLVPNNAGTGVTGDILFTTNGASAGDTYSIELHMIKKYG
jgi:hypothetical protein